MRFRIFIDQLGHAFRRCTRVALALAALRAARSPRRADSRSRKSSSPRRCASSRCSNCRRASPCSMRRHSAGCRRAAFRGRARPGSEPELGRRHFAAALFPVARHRRARAVPGRAESFRRLSDRRHRLQRHRHAGDAVRRRRSRSAARAAGHALRRECAGGIDHAAQHAEPLADSCSRPKLRVASTARVASAPSSAGRSAPTTRRWRVGCAALSRATVSAATRSSIATTPTVATSSPRAASCVGAAGAMARRR